MWTAYLCIYCKKNKFWSFCSNSFCILCVRSVTDIYDFSHNLDQLEACFFFLIHMCSSPFQCLNMVKSLPMLIFTLSALGGGQFKLSECSPFAYALPLKSFPPFSHSARGRGLIWDKKTPLRSGLLQLCPFSLLHPPSLSIPLSICLSHFCPETVALSVFGLRGDEGLAHTQENNYLAEINSMWTVVPLFINWFWNSTLWNRNLNDFSKCNKCVNWAKCNYCFL